jgi:hypothetical protein
VKQILINLDAQPHDFEEMQIVVIGCPCKMQDFELAVRKLAKEFQGQETAKPVKKPCGCNDASKRTI